MKVEIAVLRAALTRLLDHVEETKGAAVDVPEDLYWFIPRQRLHDPTSEPTGPTLGSLDDDWAEISAIAAGEKEPLGYALVWASAVVRAIGDRVV